MDFNGQSWIGRTTHLDRRQRVHPGPSYERATKPIYLRTIGTYRLCSGSRVYVDDNYAPAGGSTLSDLVVYTGGERLGPAADCHRPVWNTGLTARKTANNAVYNRVLNYAGARPRIATAPTSASFRTSRIATAASSTAWHRTARRAATGMPAAGRRLRRTRAGSRCRRIRIASPRMATPISRTGCIRWTCRCRESRTSRARHRRHRCQCIDHDVGTRHTACNRPTIGARVKGWRRRRRPFSILASSPERAPAADEFRIPITRSASRSSSSAALRWSRRCCCGSWMPCRRCWRA